MTTEAEPIKKRRKRKVQLKRKLHRKRGVGKELPLPYKEAREYVIKHIVPLGVNTRLKWHQFKDLPPNIPKHPQNVYKGEGWDGWVSWFKKIKFAEGSMWMFWCISNCITPKLISKYSGISIQTINNIWSTCSCTKRTIARICDNLPIIYEEALMNRIDKALNNAYPTEEDLELIALKPSEIRKMVAEDTLTNEELTEMIKKPHKLKMK